MGSRVYSETEFFCLKIQGSNGGNFQHNPMFFYSEKNSFEFRGTYFLVSVNRIAAFVLKTK